MDKARNEKQILNNIKVCREEIKKLGKHISKIDDWNDESFISDMNRHIDKLYENIKLARLYYKSKKK